MRKRLMGAAAPAVAVAVLAFGAGQFARAESESKPSRLDRLDPVRPAAALNTTVAPYGVAQGAEETAAAAQLAEAARRQFEAFVLAAQAQADDVAAEGAAPRRQGTGRSGGGGCTEGSIINRESKGDPGAVNPRTGAAGLYQFLPSTWAGYGGYASAADAPADVQRERFNQVWAGGSGASHWSC